MSNWPYKYRRALYLMSISGLACNSFLVGYRVQTDETGWFVFSLSGALLSLVGSLCAHHAATLQAVEGC